MNEKCPFCGSELPPNLKFCGNCGKPLTPVQEIEEEKNEYESETPAVETITETNGPVKVEIPSKPENTYTQSNTVVVQKEQYKSTAMVFGILSIFLGLITSIVGIVIGIKYRGKYNKTCPGYVISIITFGLKVIVYPIIIYAILLAIAPLWLMTQMPSM